MKKLKLTKGFCTDYCTWEDEIIATISDELQADITAAKQIMKENPSIRSINLDVSESFLGEEMSNKLYEQCSFDVEYISVYRSGGIWYNIQSKYDAHTQAEYGIEE